MDRSSQVVDLRRTAGQRGLVTDDGSAMFVVMAAMAILFVLSTMLVTMSVYNVTSSQREEVRMRALHIADAGLNAYLAGMRHDGPAYATSHPTLGPTATSDGTWTASIVASQSAYIVRSVGTVNAGGTSSTRVLVSRVAYPTYADYAVMADCDIVIGADAVFIGKVGSTGSIENSGKVYADSDRTKAGELWAGTSITTRSGSKPLSTNPSESALIHPNQNVAKPPKWVDFGQISADVTILQSTAAASGTSYARLGDSADIGYQVVLNGGTYSLFKVRGSKYSGGLAYTAITGAQNQALPSAGVLFFDDDVWVKGTYNAAITIASTGDVMLTQNITSTSPTSQFTCGLVAQSDVWIPIDYSTAELPDQLTIQAALMAIDGQCGAYFDAGGPLRTRVTFIGSRTYKVQSGLVQVSGNTEIRGFSNRVYDYDERLDIFAPPKYPVIHNGDLKVTTWQEQ